MKKSIRKMKIYHWINHLGFYEEMTSPQLRIKLRYYFGFFLPKF